MPAPPVSIQVTVSQRDIDRAVKLVDKYKDAPLAKRLTAAVKGGVKMLVGPIRGQTPRGRTGNLQRSVKAGSLRRRPGEVVAQRVGPTAPHRPLVIQGHRMVTHSGQVVGRVAGNPFVDRAVEPLMGQVNAYIEGQVRALG